jgi:hypothetical protein
MTGSTVLNKRRWIRRSEHEWREVFARFERSGQTQEQFCADQDIVLSSFTRWRQKLCHRPPNQSVAASLGVPTVAAADALFVELSSESAEQCWDVELQLGAEMVLRLRRPPC